jgi:hypothetical protein
VINGLKETVLLSARLGLVLENSLFPPCPVSARESETVVQIQFICRATQGRANSRSHLTPKQYKERKEIALGLAEKLTDNFYRAMALRHIIAFCMAVKDPDAKNLLKQVGISFIQQKIVEAHPELYEGWDRKTETA